MAPECLMIPRDDYGDPIPARDVCEEWDLGDGDKRNRMRTRTRVVTATSSAAEAQDAAVEWVRQVRAERGVA
jgi:hypothetical protein